MENSNEISSIVRASKVLRCLSQDIGRITDISKKLNISKGAIHKILKTFESTGLASQDIETRQYYLGPLIHEFTSNVLTLHKDLILVAQEELGYLRDLTGETVGLQIRSGVKRIILDELESPNPLKISRGRSNSAPIYSGAMGKILLLELTDKELPKFLSRIELKQVGSNSITDKAVLLEEIKKIRQKGYATSLNETFEGAAAIAVPIDNYAYHVALGIVGPESRFGPIMTSFIDVLKAVSDSISKKLAGFGRTA